MARCSLSLVQGSGAATGLCTRPTSGHFLHQICSCPLVGFIAMTLGIRVSRTKGDIVRGSDVWMECGTQAHPVEVGCPWLYHIARATPSGAMWERMLSADIKETLAKLDVRSSHTGRRNYPAHDCPD